jgi:hypothetical protein
MSVCVLTVIFWAVILCTFVGGWIPTFLKEYIQPLWWRPVCSSKTLVSTYKTTQIATYKIVVCTGKDRYNKLFYKSVWLHIQIVNWKHFFDIHEMDIHFELTSTILRRFSFSAGIAFIDILRPSSVLPYIILHVSACYTTYRNKSYHFMYKLYRLFHFYF